MDPEYQPHSDDLITLIIQEIITRSRYILIKKGVPKDIVEEDVHEVLAAFLFRAAIINPNLKFNIEEEFSTEEVERLINVSVQAITAVDSPRLSTIKMQLLFDTSLPIQSDHLRKEKVLQSQNVAPILKEVLESYSKKLDVVEELYRKIVTFVVLKSGLGDPMNLTVVKETTAALESSFPTSELNVFISLARSEKESQLLGLTQLVTGIRLFNKELGKGGEGISDCKLDFKYKHLTQVPTECNNLVNVIETLIEKQKARCITIIEQLHALIRKKNSELKENDEPYQPERIIEELMFFYQYLSYLKTLRDQLNISVKSLSINQEKYKDTMRELKFTCKAKTAVPVDHVYPHFMLLSTCWNAWKDELFLLKFRVRIFNRLIEFSESFMVSLDANSIGELSPFIQPYDVPLISDMEIIAKSADLMSTIGLYTKKMEVLHPGNSSLYHRLGFEYSGFCPTSIANRNGLLIIGNRNHGVIRYKDLLFAFASPAEAIEFAKNPEKIVEDLMKQACLYPQLIHILFLHKQFPTIAALENVRSFAKQKLLGKVKVTYDAGSQTDTHIVDTYIDKNYEWNEWEMRRKALVHVNLRHKLTHSTQTDKSHFRRDNISQLYPPKDQVTQTRKDGSSNVPKITTYLAGLRHDGKEPTTLTVLDLTLDIDLNK